MISDRTVIPSPFCVGKEAVGEGFIGREAQIEEYSKKLLAQENGGNLSISGLPRIGKSSLARKILTSDEAKNNDWLLIADAGNLGGCQSFFSLCKRIAHCLEKELKRVSADTRKLIPLLDAIKVSGGDYDELSWAIEDCFEALNDHGYKTVIYIDEFDYVDRVFSSSDNSDPISYFQLLRGLISEPMYNVSMLVVSRRSLSLLEERSSGASTFHGVFDNQQLTGFTAEEVKQMRNLLELHGVSLTDCEWESVLHLTGSVPYLLSLACNDLFILQGNKPTEEIISGCEQRVYEYCKDVLDLLEDEDSLRHLVQACIGPRYDIIPQQVTELENKGYLVRTGTGYEPVCNYFDQYLRDMIRTKGSMDIFPLLTSAEKKLRVIVEFVLQKKYGREWAAIVRRDYEARRTIDPKRYGYFVDFRKADKYIESNRVKFGIVEKSFLNVVSILELSQILGYYWTDFSDIFNGATYSEWETKLKLLQRARDPLAHSNPEYLSPSEIDQANTYCKEIINLEID